MCLMLPYIGIFALMIKFRVHVIDDQGICHIGLLKPAALPLIFYDIFLSCWLTALFIRPLMSSTSLLQGPSKGKLRDVARRTLLGCIIALLLSSANIFTLVYFQGYERGLICLASCTADVTLNAITIHWVTSRGGGGRSAGTAKATRDRARTVSGIHGAHSGGGYNYATNEKQVAPLDSHLSITVESYVEEYHQLQRFNDGAGTGSVGTAGSSSLNYGS